MTKCLAGIALAGVVIGMAACSALPKSPVWNEAERAVSSLPVPSGYDDAGLSRRGDGNCDIDPGCAAPSVTRTFRPTALATERASCEALHATLSAWTSAGYRFDRWYEGAGDAPDLPCNLAGSMNGLNVGAQVTPSGEIRLSALAIKKR
jgi:hypothetical protein